MAWDVGMWKNFIVGKMCSPGAEHQRDLGEPPPLEGVQVSAGQSHSRPDLALAIIQENGIMSDFQRSLPAKSSWDDNLPAGICCGKT